MPAHRRRPLLLGHRGACGVSLPPGDAPVPENTFAAFDLALQSGCDGFEFDVRRTADQRALICHDPELGGLQIAGTAYQQILKSHPARCLEEVLEGYAKRAFLDIELKVAGLEDAVLSALRQTPPQHGYVLSSFLPQVLRRLHSRHRGVPLGFICDQQKHFALWRELPVEYVIPHYKLLRDDSMQQLRSAGKKVFVWTVNREEQMLQLAEHGVDAIISDDPQELCRVLGGS